MRIHDKIYLKENRYRKPKESFKFLTKILKKRLLKKKYYDVLDIGCANGELIYHLERNFTNLRLNGFDVRNDLLKKAKKNLSEKTSLRQVNINKKIRNKFYKKYDIILVSGVISIFDDLNNFKYNLKKLLKPNGRIFIFGLFNNFDYNVHVKYEDIKNYKNIKQSGWNTWSITYLKDKFKSKKFKIHKFFINKNIKKKKLDPIRSWTIKINKKRYFTNALMIIQNQMWVEIY